MGGLKIGRIEKILVFQHICLLWRMKKWNDGNLLFFCLIENKNKMMVTVVVCEFIVLPLLHKIKLLNSKLEVIFTLLYKKKKFNLGFFLQIIY